MSEKLDSAADMGRNSRNEEVLLGHAHGNGKKKNEFDSFFFYFLKKYINQKQDSFKNQKRDSFKKFIEKCPLFFFFHGPLYPLKSLLISLSSWFFGMLKDVSAFVSYFNKIP